MAGRPPKTTATASGARLARLRGQARLSQVQLAEAVGIPQRTLSFYEREAEAIPSTLIPALAQALGVTIEEVLGIEASGARKKRGPQSQLERQLTAIASLPRKEQQQLLAVVEAFISQHTGARGERSAER
ncbi:MAG: helix-turn-helix domain-containing protein [Pyrinomonadaceae bacterium MAG19_C2-C3]|nr:helix-turn-helix domain-containing protein [Pyrinomonadaceae bacterium MAG19_C2-C3]